LTIGIAPTISSQPTSQTVNTGDAATLSVTATGSVPLSYQWQKMVSGTWTNISGATSASYSISSAQPSDAGQYQVVVSNSAGTVTSNTVSLTVNSVVTSSASFVKDDAGTQGSWASAYGADGYDISQYGASLPSYASANLLNNANYTWNGNTTDVRALR